MELIDAFIYTQFREGGNIILDGLWAFIQHLGGGKSHCMDYGRLFVHSLSQHLWKSAMGVGGRILFEPQL